MNYIGIDIGSTSAKTIVLDNEGNIVDKIIMPTGWSSVETANKIKDYLIEQNYDISNVVATGYGRVSVPYAAKQITEITCHAQGAVSLFDNDDLLVIDIGGQDTKIIEIQDGRVVNFVMNDKCSAGTGRFLEVMSNHLGVGIDGLCDLAMSGSETTISSLCTVFAESEVVGLIGKGEPKENIAYAVIDSIIKKIVSQIGNISYHNVVLTGGLCECNYIVKKLSDELKINVKSMPNARYAGALGAAIRGKE